MLDLALDVSLRSVAGAAAVGLVLVALRVRSGAVRHAAWSAVLLTMLTMPLLMAAMPRLEVPVPGGVESGFAAIAGQVMPPIEDPAPVAVVSAPSRSTIAVVPTVVATARPAHAVLEPLNAALVLYVAGVVVLLARLAAGWALARRLVSRAVRVSCDSRAPVFETTAIAAPMAVGIFSPAVLLPTEWREWPADKLAVVLAHEQAHIRRRDALVALLAQVNRAVFWFHPLAWWLERTLAIAAEHACDEAAAREMGQPERYAQVLLDMADAVRRRGQRVSWQTLGMDGSKRLGARIDRLVEGDAMAQISVARRAAVAAGCGTMLVLAIACRQQVAAEPLRADPAVQKQIDDNKTRGDRFIAARSLTPEQAGALERSLEVNPDDVDARESLIIYYDQSGKPTWEQKLAGIRKHALWRIAHLPDTDLWVPNISKRYDPAGYAEAKTLWLEQTSRPGVTAKTLGRAAAFFAANDKALAETLFVRAEKLEPAGLWRAQRVLLYAQAIGEAERPELANGDPVDPIFAAGARRTVEASTDPNLLAAMASALTRWATPAGNVSALSQRLLDRAIELDPQNVRARTILANLQYNERRNAIEEKLRPVGGTPRAFGDFSDVTTPLSTLSVEDRLFYLPEAAERAYMRAENIDYMARQHPTGDPAKAIRNAAQGFAQARQLATEALALARTNDQAARVNDVVYRAETVLGVMALKDGDRRAAVQHMRAAGTAPMPEPVRYAPDFGMRSRLAEYLLRAGERTSVADFLEQSAARRPGEREQLLADAQRIREGLMPRSYQYAESRR